MSRLPVIVGFGGVNAAGRSSFHHAYRRMVSESLGEPEKGETYLALASMMGLVSYKDGVFLSATGIGISETNVYSILGKQIDQSTLIRRIESQYFDVNATPWQKSLTMAPMPGESVQFVCKRSQLPDIIPLTWQVTSVDEKMVQVVVKDNIEVKVTDHRIFPVQSAGQLPTGFSPEKLYQSRNHPRGLQMTVYGASDALFSMGIDWQTVRSAVKPDQIGVYAVGSMSQLDFNGSGGLLQSRLMGKRVTSKQCALGFAQMPADFINAYLLGNIGATGGSVGACASFLYNLRSGVDDIRSGRRRVVLVGTSEAPVTSEIADGYAAMGALGTAEDILALDKHKGATQPDLRRASRPFAENCGFTLAESAQFVVLFDDELAVELGASIYGAIGDIYAHADGFKKSISAPGIGNYITMAKAVAGARAILGEQSVRAKSFVHAHGSSTPQNRVTESHIINETAKAFGIEHWPVAAIKSYLGHTIGSAAGDQVNSTLGVWQYGFIPGIKTIDKIADDVYSSHLNISMQDIDVGVEGIDVAFINTKGFGGNNATASILAPHIVASMLQKKHGKKAMAEHAIRNQGVAAQAAENDTAITQGRLNPVYLFDHNVVDPYAIKVQPHALTIPGYDQPIDLNIDNPYEDMC